VIKDNEIQRAWRLERTRKERKKKLSSKTAALLSHAVAYSNNSTTENGSCGRNSRLHELDTSGTQTNSPNRRKDEGAVVVTDNSENYSKKSGNRVSKPNFDEKIEGFSKNSLQRFSGGAGTASSMTSDTASSMNGRDYDAYYEVYPEQSRTDQKLRAINQRHASENVCPASERNSSKVSWVDDRSSKHKTGSLQVRARIHTPPPATPTKNKQTVGLEECEVLLGDVFDEKTPKIEFKLPKVSKKSKITVRDLELESSEYNTPDFSETADFSKSEFKTPEFKTQSPEDHIPKITPPTIKPSKNKQAHDSYTTSLLDEEEALKQELRGQTSTIPIPLTVMSTPTRKGSSSNVAINEKLSAPNTPRDKKNFSPSVRMSSYKPSPAAASSQQLLLHQSSKNNNNENGDSHSQSTQASNIPLTNSVSRSILKFNNKNASD